MAFEIQTKAEYRDVISRIGELSGAPKDAVAETALSVLTDAAQAWEARRGGKNAAQETELGSAEGLSSAIASQR